MNGPVPMVVALAQTRKGVRLEYWISKPYTFSSSRTTVGSRSRLFLGELQKRGPACEAAQPDLCLCDSPYISRLIVVKFWMIARPAVAVLDIYIYVQLVASITMTRRRVLQ